MYIWTNERVIERNRELVGKVGTRRTPEDLLQMSQEVNVGLWYGDFHSPNDGYPLLVEKAYRRRIYYIRDDWNKLVRVEMSKAMVDGFLNPKLPSDHMPKL